MVKLRLIQEGETEMEVEERKTEMEVGDCSMWHYLIFCEEFVSDANKNDFVCWVCKESMLGHPTFKCLECSFIQHRSCPQLLDFKEMSLNHCTWNRHHLILRKEKENNGTKKVVCAGCGKLTSSPAYRCSIPHCAFRLHKSCDQLSHAIWHNAHPDHTLILSMPPPPLYYRCDVCKKDREKRPTLLYGCRLCDFDMDNSCVFRWDVIESERKMEVGDYSLWHHLIFCEEFVSDACKNDFVCWVCKESVLGHPAFKCLECGFVQHKSCSNLPDLTKMDVKHDIRERHHLLLREEMVNNGKEEAVCLGCGKLVSGPTYRCSIPQCTFHLHKSCDQLSHVIQHIRHPYHTLFLRLPTSYTSCDLCKKKREKHPLLYGCRICNFYVDIKCLPRWDIIESERKMEVGDYSLWHYLIFCEEFVSDDYKNDIVCWMCEEPILGHPTFKCLECSFVQHKSCTQLPDLTKANEWHRITNRHHLILREQTEDDREKKVLCVACEKLASSPTYRCSIPHCAFHLHKSCDQLSHAILHNAHPNHTLILSVSSSYCCKVCSRSRKKRHALHYRCRLCYFHMDYKCSSRWDIIESERNMEFGDCSIWHYLIFCKEFSGDGDVCWVCEELLSGYPSFKCLECDFVQHKSCTQVMKMEYRHDITDRHHLISRKEREDNGKKKLVCAGCTEVVSGPTYRCSLLKCAFRLHKSCHQLSRAIQNSAHPKHALFLKLSRSGTHCHICVKDRRMETTLLYNCDLCEFEMHYKCAASVEVIEDSDCNPHVLFLRRMSIPFTCEACGAEVEDDVASQCSKCGVLTHLICAHFPRTIKIKSHHHLLSRTYCLHRIKKLEKAICKLCCIKVNIKYGAYCGRECDYIVHMRCAKLNEDKSTNSSEVEDYTRHLVYLIEGLDEEKGKATDVPSKINHNNHPEHELILRFEDFGNDKQLHKNSKQCAVCMQFIISSPFYSCEDCNNIFLHKRCAQLPQTVRRPLYAENSFALSSHLLSSTKNLFMCYQCSTYRHGLFYQSRFFNKIDVQCFLIPETISHKSHDEHLLHIPVLRDPRSEVTCIGCGKKIYHQRRYLMCSDCEFWLCLKCATLPLVARYKYHPHLLKLTYKWMDNSKEYYCLICEEKLDPKHWFYSCGDCDFPTHIKCLIGGSLKSGRHEHPVILLFPGPKYSLRCHLCEKRFGHDDKVLECPQCKFYFHFQCFY